MLVTVDTAKKRRVTAEDVARLAGCSQASVSLWVTGKFEGRLTVEWQQRIAAAVKELGYVPNRAARRLVSGGTPSASIIFPGPRYAFFGPVLSGVTDALGPEWDILFFDARPGRIDEGGSRLVSSAISADTTGVIVASPSESDLDDIERIAARALVVVDSPRVPDGVSLVAFDMSAAIGEAVDHIATLGHRRVGYVAYPGAGLTLSERRERLLATLSTRSVVAAAELATSSLEIDVTADEFAAIWDEWRAAGVTAVICGDERQAYGVLSAAHRLGIRVPEDLSIVSFRDSEIAWLFSPPLSSIRLPAVELGISAGRALTALVRGEAPTTTLIPATYVSRGSTGPARTQL
jgi:LacI family transcriptional regulator